jgi:hypothetical protein
MSHLCSFLSITAGHFTLEFPSLYETEDWNFHREFSDYKKIKTKKLTVKPNSEVSIEGLEIQKSVTFLYTVPGVG